jgi:hypothetical protein
VPDHCADTTPERCRSVRIAQFGCLIPGSIVSDLLHGSIHGDNQVLSDRRRLCDLPLAQAGIAPLEQPDAQDRPEAH